MSATVIVVMSVDLQQQGVQFVSEFGHPTDIGSDVVEHVSVEYEKFPAHAFVNIIAQDREISVGKGRHVVQKIVVIPSDVYDFRVALDVQHQGNERVVHVFPAFPVSYQMPAVYDVSVENQFFTTVFLEKIHGFDGMGKFRSDMNIRQNDGLVFFRVHYYDIQKKS